MNRRFFLLPHLAMWGWFLLCFTYSSSLTAQSSNQEEYCGSDQLNESLLRSSIVQRSIFEKMNNDWERWVLEGQPQRVHLPGIDMPAYDPVTLPVVFHDLTTGGGLYLSTNDFAGILGALNTNFAAEPNINFCLAEVDAFGVGFSESEGDSPVAILDNGLMSQINAVADVIQSSGSFPPTDYINIYVVDDIVDPVAGFAFLPNAHGASFDGIYIEAQYVTGGSPIVLTHEMGHYLGLHHTFGRCDPLFEACSCTNDNCLLDGDMVCDTPPDFSTAFEPTCTPPNTCSTDPAPLYNQAGDQLNPFAADFPGNTGPIDADDFIHNYMDYGNWACQISFTPGQADRMRFMIDENDGPRNSLLNSNVCNPACALGSDCKVIIAELPPLELLGVPYEHTLELSGPSVSHTFMAEVIGCPSFDTYDWVITNLDTDLPHDSGTGLSINSVFTVTGNYRIEFTASTASSNPVCERSATYDIQVVGAIANGGNCIGINWDDLDRIEYTGGWVYNTRFPIDGLRDASSSGPVNVTGPNNTANSSPFAVISGTIPGTDEVYGGFGMPNGLNDVFRVGRVIDGDNQNPLPDGAAYYVTYTFTPTEENNRLRVWYLGLRENPGTGSNSSRSNFANTGTTTDGFGVVLSYENDGGDFRGKTHNQSSFERTEFNNFFFENDNNSDNVDAPRTEVFIDGQGPYMGLEDWAFHDMDLSMFVCEQRAVTLTFYARTNAAINAFFHSYAYFGLQCLPGVPGTPIDFDFPNVYVDCTTTDGMTCAEFNFDLFDASLIPNNMGQRLPAYFADLDVAWSPDGMNWGNFESVSGSQPEDEDPNYVFELCREGNANPVEYFKLRYTTPCKTYEDVIAFHQGFSHEVDPCPELSDGTARGGEIPPDVSSEIFVCDSATVTLTKPCWWQEGLDITYQWQVYRNGSWRNFNGNGNEEVILDASNLTSFPLDFSQCSPFRRLASFADPYCGVEVMISSEIYSLTIAAMTNPSLTGNVVTNNVCLGEEVFLQAITSSSSGEAACVDQTTANQMTISMFDTDDNPIIGNFTDSGSMPLATGTHTYTYDYMGDSEQSVPDIFFDFVNNSLVDFELVIRAEGVAFDCPFEWENTVLVQVKESAIAGEIELVPCSNPIRLATVNTDNNNDNGYQWEYSYDNVNFVSFPGATDADYQIPAGFPFTGFPVFIRRAAIGTQDCPALAYSNIIILENGNNAWIPEFEQVPPICTGDPLANLPTTSINGITGSWSPAINNMMTTTYVFTPDPGQKCAVGTEMTIIVNNCGGDCFELILESVACASQGSNTPETCDDQWTFWINTIQGDAPGSFVWITVDGGNQTATSYNESKQVGFFNYSEYPDPVEVEVCDNIDPTCCVTMMVSPPPFGSCSPPPCTGFNFINYSVTCDEESMTICYDVVGTSGQCWASSVKTSDDPDDHGVHLGDGIGDQTGICHTITGADLQEVLAFDDDHIVLWGMICDTYNNSDCDDAPPVSECIIDIVIPYDCISCSDQLEVVIECRENQAALTAYIDGVFADPLIYSMEWQVADMVFPASQNPIITVNEIGSTYTLTVLNFGPGDLQTCEVSGIISCDKLERAGFLLFPNPLGDNEAFRLKCSDDRFLKQEVKLSISNALGVSVYDQRLIMEQTILLQPLREGTYYLTVINVTTQERVSLPVQVLRR